MEIKMDINETPTVLPVPVEVLSTDGGSGKDTAGAADGDLTADVTAHDLLDELEAKVKALGSYVHSELSVLIDKLRGL
jgi:hypothetical protein